MATARKEPTSDYNLILTLNSQEAETLQTILGNIGGDPKTSPRKYSDAIWDALKAAGVEYSEGIQNRLSTKFNSLYFSTF